MCVLAFPPLVAALILTGIGVFRAPRAPSPGLLPSTLTLCACGVVFGLGGDLSTTFRVVASKTPGEKEIAFGAGLEALQLQAGIAAIAVLGVLALHGLSVARTRRAGLPVVRPAGVVIGVVLSLHVGWMISGVVSFALGFWQLMGQPPNASVGTTAAALMSAVGMGIAGCLFGFVAGCLALVLGLADERARIRAAALED